jgi:RNA polymerase sigma-70 factor (ECF subfamily)
MWARSELATADPADDAVTIERVLAGDTQQFAQLVKRYQGPLYRHAVGMVLDHDVAADMVQDSFIRAYTQLASCRDRRRFRSWIFQTLRNRCLDYLKEARRRNVPLEYAEAVIDPAGDPVAAVQRARLRADLEQALARLQPAQREAFVMHYVEGVPYETMAELLDASVSALKMRVLRAREALAAALGGRDVTETPPARLAVRRG